MFVVDFVPFRAFRLQLAIICRGLALVEAVGGIAAVGVGVGAGAGEAVGEAVGVTEADASNPLRMTGYALTQRVAT